MKIFVDTNILVYAHDRGAGHKHEVARDAVEALWESGNGIISTQILQEFYVNVRRKAANPVSDASARSLIEDYIAWDPVVNDGASVIEAIDIERRFRLSFWDALVIVAAHRAGAGVVLSEDFSHGQTYGDVQVVDPFES